MNNEIFTPETLDLLPVGSQECGLIGSFDYRDKNKSGRMSIIIE